MIDCVPIMDMTQLLINFKTPEFRARYDKQKAPITACNDNLDDDQLSTYWLLNNNKGTDVKLSGTWEDQQSTIYSNDIVLNNFMIKVGNGLNEALDKNNQICVLRLYNFYNFKSATKHFFTTLLLLWSS